MVLDIYPFFAILPAAMFLIITLYLDFEKNKAVMIEEKYPELHERLRTAFDHAPVENEVVNELHAEVMQEMKKVSVSSFIDTKKTTSKIGVIMGLCFIILLLAAIGINVKLNMIFKDSGLFGYPSSGDGSGSKGDTPGAGGGEDKNIFGDEKVATLGDEELQLQLKTVSYEVLSGNNYKEPPDVNFEETFPDTICADDPQGCGNEQYSEDKTPVEHAELVKNYFLNIAK